MSLDKKSETTTIREIEFNWERVVERANIKKQELIQNAPKVTSRQFEQIPQITDSSKNDKYPITTSANAVVARDDDGPDRNVIEIIKGIKNNNLVGKDLTIDERRMVVNSLRMSGHTQDSISDLLQISRRTIVNDYRHLRQQAALQIASKETNEIAGEVYEVAKSCIRKALKAGHYKTVSTIMRDMVEVLQSMGIIYRAPKTSMQASLYGSINSGNKQGYHKYMEAIGDDKNKVVEVLDCMFNAITDDRLN